MTTRTQTLTIVGPPIMCDACQQNLARIRTTLLGGKHAQQQLCRQCAKTRVADAQADLKLLADLIATADRDEQADTATVDVAEAKAFA